MSDVYIKQVLPVQEDDFHVHILSVFMKEIFQEVWNWFVSDVAAHDNMPVGRWYKKNIISTHQQ